MIFSFFLNSLFFPLSLLPCLLCLLACLLIVSLCNALPFKYIVSDDIYTLNLVKFVSIEHRNTACPYTHTYPFLSHRRRHSLRPLPGQLRVRGPVRHLGHGVRLRHGGTSRLLALDGRCECLISGGKKVYGRERHFFNGFLSCCLGWSGWAGLGYVGK